MLFYDSQILPTAWGNAEGHQREYFHGEILLSPILTIKIDSKQTQGLSARERLTQIFYSTNLLDPFCALIQIPTCYRVEKKVLNDTLLKGCFNICHMFIMHYFSIYSLRNKCSLYLHGHRSMPLQLLSPSMFLSNVLQCFNTAIFVGNSLLSHSHPAYYKMHPQN